MPEGAEVRRTADWLKSNLTGCVVREVEAFNRFEKCPIVRLGELKGKRVLDVRARGKVIAIDLEGDVTAISRLGMTGRWTREEGKHLALRVWCELPPTRGMFPVCYLDQRRFGNFFVADRREATSLLDELGWDALAEPAACGKARVRAIPHTRKKVCDVLLRQDVFAGVGNYVRAEAMYRAAVDPDRLVGDLSEEAWDRLCVAVADVLRESYESGGATLESYYGGDGERGDYVDRLRVYGRSHDPEGRPVSRKKDSSGRTVWWVPEVQR